MSYSVFFYDLIMHGIHEISTKDFEVIFKDEKDIIKYMLPLFC